MAGRDKKMTDPLKRLTTPLTPISGYGAVISQGSHSFHPASPSQTGTGSQIPASPLASDSQTAACDFSLTSSSGSSKTPSLQASSSSSCSSSSWPSSSSGCDFGGSQLQGSSFWSGQRREVDVTPRFSGMSLGDVMRVTVMQEMARLNMNRQEPVDLSKSKT